jgi:hypothetical protein
MSTKGKQVAYEYQGTLLTADEVKSTLEWVLDSNIKTQDRKNGKKVPFCIWGKHGIGKTSIPEQIAAERGIGFRSIPSAQFEEMGDLTGMPGTGAWINLKNDDGEVIKSKLVDKDLVGSYVNLGWERDMTKSNQMMISPPSWVPDLDLGHNEKGIFCIDDFNRANGRIINGIMQLLQDGKLTSWSLPPQWTIVLTANPPGGDYATTELDDAQLTRMSHVSMEFEPKVWARWALKSELDQRVVNFVLAHPEAVKSGEMTTPRSIEYFSNLIHGIEDLKASLGLVNILGNSVLDKTTATQFSKFINNNLVKLISPEELTQFSTFINNNLVKLISPEELLSAANSNFKKVMKDEIVTPYATGSNMRVDILNVLTTRLVYYCTDELKGKLNKKQFENLKGFLKTKEIPNDIRLEMLTEIMSVDGMTKLKSVASDPELGTLLLNRM